MRNDTARILDAIGKVSGEVTGLVDAIKSLDAKVTRMLAALGRLDPPQRLDAGSEIECDGTIH